MTSDEIQALLQQAASGRFASSGDAVIIPLDRIPEEQQDEVIAWVKQSGGRLEHIAPPRPFLRRLTPRRSSLGPLCLVIPHSALF